MGNTDKLQIIISTLCSGNQSEFGRRLGLAQSTANAWLKRDTMDPFKVLESFPEVSAEWLMRGKGSMLLADNTPTVTNTVHGDGDAISGTKIEIDTKLAAQLEELSRQIRSLQEQNFQLTSKLLSLLN